MKISARIPLVPFGAARHRARAMPSGKRNNRGDMIWRAQIYMDPKYRAWIKEASPYFYRVAPESPMAGPLKLSMVVVVPFLKSDRRKIHVPRKWCSVKPDLDNVEKAVLDCAEAAGWIHNDSQICRGVKEKVRAAQGEDPFISVTIETIETPYHVR